jgi:undecaprenyl-phosphate galactose phosphotransferase
MKSSSKISYTNAPAARLSPVLENASHAEKELGQILDHLNSETSVDGLALPVISFDSSTPYPLRGYKWMDFAALIMAFLVAWCLAVTINSLLLDRNELQNAVHNGLAKITQSLFVGLCVIGWFAHSGHYRIRMPFWTEMKKIMEAIGFAMLIDIFFRFIVKQDFSRLWLISGWAFAAIGIVCARGLWRRVMRKKGLWNIRTVLVGRGDTANEARLALASEPGLGFDIVAQISNLPVAFQQAGGSWQQICATHRAAYVVIALDGDDLVKAAQPFAQLMRENVPFSVSPPLHNIPVFGMMPQYFFNHDVMLLTHNHKLNQNLPQLIKRTFDIVIASCALAVLSPILLAVAIMVKKDGGPALFGHKRLGLNGKVFHCLKFRSMIINSDEVLKKHLAQNAEARVEWQNDLKLRNDPRVTTIGKLLRRTSIDELPQLLNVLKGEMSIVGPRPIIVAETEKYDNDISHYYRVRPGITGLWQVSGRNDVTYSERVRMDSWYVRNWSLWHDIMIVCKTFPAVLKRSGAY